jgi:hypothetical protein
MSVIISKNKKDLQNILGTGYNPSDRYFICNDKYITITKDHMICPECNKIHTLFENIDSSYFVDCHGEGEIKICCSKIYSLDDPVEADRGSVVDMKKPFEIRHTKFKKWTLRKENGDIIIRIKLNKKIIRRRYEKINGEKSFTTRRGYFINLQDLPRIGDIILIGNVEIEKKENTLLYGYEKIYTERNYDTDHLVNGFKTTGGGISISDDFSLYTKYLQSNDCELYIEYIPVLRQEQYSTTLHRIENNEGDISIERIMIGNMYEVMGIKSKERILDNVIGYSLIGLKTTKELFYGCSITGLNPDEYKSISPFMEKVNNKETLLKMKYDFPDDFILHVIVRKNLIESLEDIYGDYIRNYFDICL